MKRALTLAAVYAGLLAWWWLLEAVFGRMEVGL